MMPCAAESKAGGHEGVRIEHITGVVLIALGIKVALSSQK